MDKQLRRILNLVRKTGDRMVVTDTNGDDVYVVMGLEQYENLVVPKEIVEKSSGLPSEAGFGEEWWNDCEPEEEEGRVGPPSVAVATTTPDPSFQKGGETRQAPPPSDIWEAMSPAGSESETWDISKMSDVEKTDLERQFENYQQGKGMATAEPEKSAAEAEPKKEDQKDEDFGEEQFYLEPIE
ncbi:MAG: hypothetical protein WCO25_01410 [Candidatus Uhrbacteria bacterium]